MRLFACPRPTPAGLVSLVLHALLLAASGLIPAISPLEALPEDTISVEVVVQERDEPAFASRASEAPIPPGDAPAAETPPPRAATSTSPAPAIPAVPPGAVRAIKLFSDAILDSPRSRGTRALLAQLDEAERIEQLCSLEAMSQIHSWNVAFKPDRVVADTMSATRLSADTLQADGAVFRSKQQWYALTFTCEMARNRNKVAAFSFEVGAPVPRREWAALNLPAIH